MPIKYSQIHDIRALHTCQMLKRCRHPKIATRCAVLSLLFGSFFEYHLQSLAIALVSRDMSSSFLQYTKLCVLTHFGAVAR